MIADWTVDVGPESPVIVLPWEGWVDLTDWSDDRAAKLTEVAHYPELLQLLKAGNGRHTSTAKVDVFAVTREEVDPEIAEAGLEATAFGLCSYLDLVCTEESGWCGFALFEEVARDVAAELNDLSVACGPDLSPLTVVEVVVRPAQLYDKQTFGWTLYATGFGADEARARAAWLRAARLVVETAVQRIARAAGASSGARLGSFDTADGNVGE